MLYNYNLLKGSVKNNLVEFAPKFAVDLIDLIEQVSEDSETAEIACYFEDFCEWRSVKDMVKLGCAAKQMSLGCKNAKLFLTET